MSDTISKKRVVFPVSNDERTTLKHKMLNWANRFGIFLFLDSNGYTAQGGRYECLLGAGAVQMAAADVGSFDQLGQFQQANPGWLFGHLAYDLKNDLEPGLQSGHPVRHGFQPMSFFVPEVVMGMLSDEDGFFIEAEDPQPIYEALLAADAVISGTIPSLAFTQRTSQQEYLQAVAALREHIRNGDCYEINYCCEGYATGVSLEPLPVFDALNKRSPAPFAAFYKHHDQYLLCASPERYLRKEGTRIISQPIKGTARRGRDAAEDDQLKESLRQSEKERAENVMIVDLVRNDLARSCAVGSVQVDELFGLYSFPQVHQMISTVSGMLKPDVLLTDALKYSFPMGSMTGAPKVKVMQLIEHYEKARRELFSGSVGYISPEGDFDFNVVIRSLFYNGQTGYLSYQTGGAITWDSDPMAEWEEMRLKAAGLEGVFR